MIRIANPRPGEALFTSARAAKKYVEKKKKACMLPDGTLFFFRGARMDQERNDVIPFCRFTDFVLLETFNAEGLLAEELLAFVLKFTAADSLLHTIVGKLSLSL